MASLRGVEHTGPGEQAIEALTTDRALAIARARVRGTRFERRTEDVVAIETCDNATLLVVANGPPVSANVAVGTVLDAFRSVPVDGLDLLDVFEIANEAVLEAQTGQSDGEPATLAACVLVGRRLKWVAVGDPMLFAVAPCGALDLLPAVRSHEVGEPGFDMDELAMVLPAGVIDLEPGTWIVLLTRAFMRCVSGPLGPILAGVVATAVDAGSACEHLLGLVERAGGKEHVATVVVRVPE